MPTLQIPAFESTPELARSVPDQFSDFKQWTAASWGLLHRMEIIPMSAHSNRNRMAVSLKSIRQFGLHQCTSNNNPRSTNKLAGGNAIKRR